MTATSPASGRGSILGRPAFWVAAYASLWFVVGLFPFIPTDLDLVFWPSAQAALAGHPLMVYQPAGQTDFPNANGPLSLVPLTAVGALVRALGWMGDAHLRRATTAAFFSIFIFLMAREAVAAIERLRGARLANPARPLTYAVLLLAPPLWQSLLGFGHIEQGMEVWLVLVSVRWFDEGRVGRAGLAFALAVLARTPAAFLFIPIGIAAWRRAPGAFARLATFGAATGLLGLAPFFLADRADVVHSLVAYRGGLPVGAGSVWSLAHGTALEAVGRRWDLAFVLVAVLLTNAWLATRPGGFTGERLYAGLALTSASFILLAKTVWPYYFMEAFVFVIVWAIGRRRERSGLVSAAILGAAICGLGLVAEIGSTPHQVAALVALEGGTAFVVLAAMMLWIGLEAARPPASRAATRWRRG